MKRAILVAVLTFAAAVSLRAQQAQEDYLNCFGVIAGKDATVDGSVIFGHNEDDGGEQMLNMYIAPATEDACKYIWAEFPGMSVADSFINEYGVAVSSDACNSREDRKDLTDGGVLYEVRVGVGKHARSARDAVRIIGEMVEQYGYSGSGRSYLVADPNEGWVVAIVRGRHWVAQRVPDDQVMCIPNHYCIDKVDLSDTTSFAGSPDIIDYAIERGWYDPETDGEFSFARAYSNPETLLLPRNVTRHEYAYSYVTGEPYVYDVENLDFAMKPAHKISVQDVAAILSIHSPETSEDHPASICAEGTVLSAIFHLQSSLPREIGCVMWACAGHPCAGVYVPWHLGMTASPEGWARFTTIAEAEEKHFSDSENKRESYPNAHWWRYVDRWNDLNEDYDGRIEELQQSNARLQERLFKREARLQKRLTRMSPARAARTMNRFTARIYKKY